jgi:hypothetical protein
VTSVAFAQLVVALAKNDFEIRLIEGGALAIFDLRYEPGCQIRPVPSVFVKAVFDNADRIGRWLERDDASDP